MLFLFGLSVGLAASYAAYRYGRRVEARYVADVLRVRSWFRGEYEAVVRDIKSRESGILARVRSYL